jgi:hypothetical protein
MRCAERGFRHVGSLLACVLIVFLKLYKNQNLGDKAVVI